MQHLFENHSTNDEQEFEKNVGLVHMVVNRFANRSSFDREELFQIGAIGLVKAIQNFDETRGYAFSTYAVPLIVGEIKVAIRSDNPIHVSRGLKENAYFVEKIRQQLVAQTGMEPTMNELERVSGLSREQIVESMEAGKSVGSLEEPIKGEEQDRTLKDCVEDTNNLTACVENQMAVEKLMEGLEDIEKKLVELRYYKEWTQAETGRALSMTQVAVSRLEKKVLTKLRMLYNGN